MSYARFKLDTYSKDEVQIHIGMFYLYVGSSICEIPAERDPLFTKVSNTHYTPGENEGGVGGGWGM